MWAQAWAPTDPPVIKKVIWHIWRQSCTMMRIATSGARVKKSDTRVKSAERPVNERYTHSNCVFCVFENPNGNKVCVFLFLLTHWLYEISVFLWLYIQVESSGKYSQPLAHGKCRHTQTWIVSRGLLFWDRASSSLCSLPFVNEWMWIWMCVLNEWSECPWERFCCQ